MKRVLDIDIDAEENRNSFKKKLKESFDAAVDKTEVGKEEDDDVFTSHSDVESEGFITRVEHPTLEAKNMTHNLSVQPKLKKQPKSARM